MDALALFVKATATRAVYARIGSRLRAFMKLSYPIPVPVESKISDRLDRPLDANRSL